MPRILSVILLVFFANACVEKKKSLENENNLTFQQPVGTWVPQHIKWEKVGDDTLNKFAEIKSYYLRPDGALTIIEGIHYLNNDSITFKNNIKTYKGRWKTMDGKLNVEYSITNTPTKVVIEEVGLGKIIHLNADKYEKVNWAMPDEK